MGLERRPSWSAELATGVEAIDAEHRLQVTLIDALEELVRSGQAPAAVHRTLGQLVEFTEVHFVSEELMMRVYGYPHLALHRAEHAQLLVHLRALAARLSCAPGLDGPDGPAALQGLRELRRWLTRHIQDLDQAFTAWCAGNSVDLP